jgi:hypothetical protein
LPEGTGIKCEMERAGRVSRKLEKLVDRSRAVENNCVFSSENPFKSIGTVLSL